MVSLTAVSVFATSDPGTVAAATDLDIIQTPEGPRLLAVTGLGGTLSSWGIEASGAPLLLSSLPLAPAGYYGQPQIEVLSAGDDRAVTLFGIRGTAGASYRLAEDARLTGRQSFSSPAVSPPDLRHVASIGTGVETVLFGTTDTPGEIARLAFGAGGQFRTVGTTRLAGAANDRIAALAMADLPTGRLLVVATDGQRPGLHVFTLSDLGALSPLTALPQIDAIGLSGASAVGTAHVAGVSYVLVAGAVSSSITVFRLQDGRLDATDHILDSRFTRFKAISNLEICEVDGQVYLVASGADDGVTLFTLLPGGRLLHLWTLEDSTGMTLESGGALAVLADGRRLTVFVGGGNGTGITRLEFDMGPKGVSVSGGAGTISGTTGADRLFASTGTTTVDGGGGDDILGNAGQPVTLRGGSGRDIFVLSPVAGTVRIADFDPAQDRIDLGMFPMLYSLAQVTLTPTSSGAVLSYAGTGIEIGTSTLSTLPAQWFTDARFFTFDRLNSLALAVPLIATDGPDRLIAGGEPVEIRALAGDDTLAGGPGDDRLWGDEGNDAISGGAGHDLLHGGDEADRLSGDEGNDTLSGGAGADQLHGGAGDDELDGGEDADLLSGGDGADLLRGGSGNDTLHGEDGDDRLFGEAGFDTIIGGAGKDLIDGGMQADYLAGNDGNDTLIGGQGFDVLSGGAGDDFLHGGSEEDWIFGGWNNDTIHGDAGHDFLFGGIGFDTIYGGDGDDRIEGEGQADFLQGGEGNDRIFGRQGFDVLSGNNGNDTLDGGSEEDWLFGGWGDDLIRGGTGEDFLFGGIGNDTLEGNAGHDQLNGEWGHDRLHGGDGNDTLRPGGDDDIVFGGAGADRFILSDGGHDRIADFEPWQAGEVIVLTAHGIAGGWNELTRDRMQAVSGGVLIDLGGGNSLTLEGLVIGQLSADDFLF